MSNDTPHFKYFLYARKSSESDDRQVQSIGDQKDRLLKLAKDAGLEIVAILEESKSAKKPHNRPVFAEMLSRIEQGEANGILCWEINRLSRNPVDSGTIQWMLQQGRVLSIRTISREYKPDDNALLLSVESGSANQFILDMKKGVRRGIDSKLEKGLAPIMAPPGYMNSKYETRGENYIAADPERFPLIRKTWELMLTQAHTPPKILDILNNEWGYRSRQMKHQGGKPLSRSTIYRIFTDTFYAGLFVYRGKTYQGKHPPMVTLAEFDKVQLLLGREGKPRPKTHEFPFTGIIKCGECGCSITAINKTKIIKATGAMKTFTYYYCTRRSLKGKTCSQKLYISGDELERQIEQEILNVSILPDFKDWALGILREEHQSEVAARNTIYESQERTISEARKQLDNLTSLRLKDLIDDTEFADRRTELQSQITELSERLRQTLNRGNDWVKLMEQGFEFAANAHKAFLNGDLQTKKELMLTLGQNYILMDRKLELSRHFWLEPFFTKMPTIQNAFESVRTKKYSSPARQKAAFAALRPLVRE